MACWSPLFLIKGFMKLYKPILNLLWWLIKYPFLHFSSYQQKYPFPCKSVVPSIHEGSMESKNLNSTFRCTSDIQEFTLLVILYVISLFSNFTIILQYFIILDLTDYQYRLRCQKELQLNSGHVFFRIFVIS